MSSTVCMSMCMCGEVQGRWVGGEGVCVYEWAGVAGRKGHDAHGWMVAWFVCWMCVYCADMYACRHL